MPGMEANAVTKNLLRAMRFFGSARSNGEIRDLPGVCLISCGLNYAAFNAALLSEPVSSDASALRDRIQTPASHFRSRNLRWTYWLCDDYLGPSLRRESRSIFNTWGMATLTEPPGMFAERLLPPRRRLPELVVKPVGDEPTRRAFGHVTSIAFEIPQDICRDIYGSSLAWQGELRGFVGFVDNLPVATAATIVAADVAGVYSVGTLPQYRRRGYAEAMMRHALSIERENSGIEATVLQATESGLRMYQHMGYRKATKFSVYIS